MQTKSVNLTEIRIFVDTLGLADMESMPEDMVRNTDEEKQRYVQFAWLQGMDSIIEAKERLEICEINIDKGVYR